MNRPPASRTRDSRRSSFARRDSNLALLAALFSGVILALALLLLLFSRVNPEQGSRLRGATLDGLGPILSVARAPVEAVRQIGAKIGEHWQVVERNRRLEASLKAATKRANEAEALAVEVKRMDALIALKRPERRLVASAVASASSGNAGLRSAIISAGLADGVRPRMPVIAAEGLAGRVVETGHGAARILLLTDASSRVPVKVLRTGWTGLAIGNGGALLDFAFDIASGTDKVRVGDRLVTSGDGGLYPPNVPVAVVIDVSREPPRARPLANPTGLGVVMVEAPWLPPPDFVPAPPAPSEADKAAPAALSGSTSAGSSTGATRAPAAPSRGSAAGVAAPLSPAAGAAATPAPPQR